jgi:ribosomal protein L34
MLSIVDANQPDTLERRHGFDDRFSRNDGRMILSMRIGELRAEVIEIDGVGLEHEAHDHGREPVKAMRLT